MRTRDGKSRRFAFLGYKTENEALKVAKYFNGTFIGSTRIEVEIAKSSREAPLPRKRLHAADVAPTEEIAPKTKTRSDHKKQKRQVLEEPQDEKLKAYLEAMQPLQNQKSWVNDDIVPSITTQSSAIQNDPESDVEYDDVPVVKSGGPDGFQGSSKDEGEDDEEPMIALSDLKGPNEDSKEQPQEAEAGQADAEVAKDEKISDLDWLRMRQERMKENEDNDTEKEQTGEASEHSESEKNDSTATGKLPTKALKPPRLSQAEVARNKISISRRLFIRNIAYSSVEDDFRQLFSKYGALEEVHLPIDNRSGKPKGFAYILFEDAKDAIHAYESLDGTDFQGRLLHILAAEPKTDNKLDEFELKDLPLKKQKELRRKAAAANQQFSWNSLYLNPDAVMESVASKLGVAKSDLLEADSADSAVKRAIAESSVINNVKQYFEAKGVNLDLFNNAQRSDLVILVKNFPFDTTVEEITDLFAQYGELNRVLMPPDGGIAMIVYKYAPEARAAFTKLAYRRFKSTVLYLEKGPKGLFNEPENTDDNKDDSGKAVAATVTEKPKVAKASASEILTSTNEKEDEEVYTGPTVSLFVKNLNFSTATSALTNAFKSINGFASAKVQVKPDPKNPGKALSMGFGFVEFRTKEAADMALSLMNGHVLDGHKLELKMSHRGQEPDGVTAGSTANGSSKTKNKIIIKNLPFETTKKDVQKLLSTFGQLKSLRVPKKFNKAARGFAFAEFVTAKEAESTMKALQGTHLLGRRLVMEYAEQDAENAEEEIAKMEAKVQKQITQQTLQGLKLTGKRGVDIEEELGTNEDFD